jgi:hypothetical protein
VFFATESREISDFPRIAGLLSGKVVMRDSRRSWGVDGAMALGLGKLPFIKDGPTHSAAFTSAIAKSKKVHTTGRVTWRSIVLPLVKASNAVWDRHTAHASKSRVFPTLVLSICVLDAPMVFVEDPNHVTDPVLTPWIRLVRHSSPPDKDAGYRWHYIDVVHADFFATYLSKHFMPFATEFGRRAEKMSSILLRGGTVKTLDSFEWDEITPSPQQSTR